MDLDDHKKRPHISTDMLPLSAPPVVGLVIARRPIYVVIGCLGYRYHDLNTTALHVDVSDYYFLKACFQSYNTMPVFCF